MSTCGFAATRGSGSRKAKAVGRHSAERQRRKMSFVFLDCALTLSASTERANRIRRGLLDTMCFAPLGSPQHACSQEMPDVRHHETSAIRLVGGPRATAVIYLETERRRPA